jgi:hypothetical protein
MNVMLVFAGRSEEVAAIDLEPLREAEIELLLLLVPPVQPEEKKNFSNSSQVNFPSSSHSIISKSASKPSSNETPRDFCTFFRNWVILFEEEALLSRIAASSSLSTLPDLSLSAVSKMRFSSSRHLKKLGEKVH